MEFQQGLTSSGWFSVVEVKPDFDAARNSVVPINVDLTPSKKYKLELGLGYATDVGVRGSVRWTNNRVNRLGHQAGASLTLARITGTASANYQIPVRDPRLDRLMFTTTYEYENLDDTDRDTANLEAAFLHRTQDQKNYFKWFGDFRYERFSAGEQDEVTTHLVSPGLIARRRVLERADFVRDGYSVSADVRVASSALLSSTGFVRSKFNAAYLYPVGRRGRVNMRGEIGLSWVEDFDKYPASLRFFTGGDQSVRGYGYQDLGPTDSTGAVVGGKNLLVGSLGYDHRIVGKWVGAGFVDAGNAYDDSLDKVFVGAGFGLRWLAPFGSVRVDLAWPVSEDPSFNDLKFYLGLGAVL
jgi:translocation and assembly module TamA